MITTETHSMHALKERSKKRKRNGKKGPMGTSSMGNDWKPSEGINIACSLECVTQLEPEYKGVPKQKHQGHTGAADTMPYSWHSPTEFSRISGKKSSPEREHH